MSLSRQGFPWILLGLEPGKLFPTGLQTEMPSIPKGPNKNRVLVLNSSL